MATLCLVARGNKMVEVESQPDIAEDQTSIEQRELRVFEEIGDGITSVVYRGYCRGMEVAIKQLNCGPNTMSPKARTNLERELAILKKVNHPNLVKFIGVCDTETSVQIVTEFCGGGVAFDLLHNSGRWLTWPQKLKMLNDVAGAMEYLHSIDPPIIHRDLKSLNLLMMEEVAYQMDVPVVKVADFGLARMMGAAGHQSMTNDAGTCHWMAPEVFGGTQYDTKVDVYSFSMIMFEVICQDIPFCQIEAKRLGLVVVRGERPGLELVPEDCPEGLVQLMQQCWSAKASDRPDFPTIVNTLRD